MKIFDSSIRTWSLGAGSGLNNLFGSPQNKDFSESIVMNERSVI